MEKFRYILNGTRDSVRDALINWWQILGDNIEWGGYPNVEDTRETEEIWSRGYSEIQNVPIEAGSKTELAMPCGSVARLNVRDTVGRTVSVDIEIETPEEYREYHKNILNSGVSRYSLQE